jgi:hypothetical protein
MSLIISFQGLDADEGHLEAFSGTESLAGIARSLTLIAHYVATGTVRRRFPFDDSVQFYLESVEPGSFNLKFALGCAGGVALGLGTNAIYDLSKLVLAKAIGQEESGSTVEIVDLNRRRSGDIDALVEAVEPALKKGHYSIGETAERIVIKDTHTQEVIVIFDRESKAYLLDNIEADMSEQDVSISALNVNDRTGRAYFLDLGRTIPFRLPKDADPEAMGVLSKALDEYAHKTGAPIRITFRRIEAVDGRLKRVIVYSAADITDFE